MPPIPLRFTQRNADGNPGSFTLQAPLRFDFYKQQIALTSAVLYYSWRNVTTAYGNVNGLSYIWTNGTTYTVSLPPGNYGVSDMNNILQATMAKNGHYTPASGSTPAVYYLEIQDNPVYYTNTIVATPEPGTGMTPQFVVVNQPFGNLIGYTVGSYPPTQQSTTYETNGSFVPEISPVLAVNINLDICSSATVLNVHPNSIKTFSPDVPYAEQIQINPPTDVWWPITEGSYNSVRLFFTDQDDNPLEMIDNGIVVEFQITDRPKGDPSVVSPFSY